MPKNKVKFGLKNVHVYPLTETTDESTGNVAYSYENAIPWPGAVSISFAQQGGLTPFFADNRRYYVSYANNGREGEFSSALVPRAVKTALLGYAADANGALIENANSRPSPFAMAFEIDGDAEPTRYVCYNCLMTPAALSSGTAAGTREPQTDAVTISVMPRADGSILASLTAGDSPEAFAAWYDAPYESPAEPDPDPEPNP